VPRDRQVLCTIIPRASSAWPATLEPHLRALRIIKWDLLLKLLHHQLENFLHRAVCCLAFGPGSEQQPVRNKTRLLVPNVTLRIRFSRRQGIAMCSSCCLPCDAGSCSGTLATIQLNHCHNSCISAHKGQAHVPAACAAFQVVAHGVIPEAPMTHWQRQLPVGSEADRLVYRAPSRVLMNL
jgi:hypothetical protein